LGDRLSEPSSSSVLTAKVPLEQRLSNPSLPLADRLQAPRPPTLAERLQGGSPMLLASWLAPPAPMSGPSMSVQQLTGPSHQEEAEPSSLAEWLATCPNPDTLPRRFAVLLHRDPPVHDGCTYRSPINPEDPTAPRRVRQGNRVGRLPRELAAMRAEEEARRRPLQRKGGPSLCRQVRGR
jgi:hypothetical protein